MIDSPTNAPSRAFGLTLTAFGLFGGVFGGWLVLLAELQGALSLSPGALGVALTGGLLASLPVMLVGGRMADRRGVRSVLVSAAAGIALALAAAVWVGGYGGFVLCCVLFYGATGAFDVAINAAAIHTEQAAGQRIIGYFHAAFSGGAAVSALGCGALITLGVPFRAIYALLALGVGVFAAATCAECTLPRPVATPRPPRSRWRLAHPGLLLLALITALAFLAEGELGNWSAIYLRGVQGFPALLGASGLAVFHAAMLVGRLLAARVTAYLGARRLLAAAGVVVALGMTLALVSDTPLVVLLGFLTVGLALAGVAPTAFSLAGDLAAGQAGTASAVITTVGYSGYLVGPLLVGGLAEVAGLRLALLCIAVAGGLIALLSTLTKLTTPTVATLSASRPSPQEVR